MGGNLKEVADIFFEGGPVMVALAAVACILYSTSIAALVFVKRGNLSNSDSSQWRGWIEQPDNAEGRVGEIIKYAVHGPRLTVKTIHRRFDEMSEILVNTIDRRLLIISTLVAAAPMTGLLGTVFGMLDMFDGLSSGGGKQSMSMIAGGMREALFTTLTGLVVALPGMFMALVIREKRNEIATVLFQLQSAIVSSKFREI